jgi:sec-independent protein translocase protein TatA
MIMSLPIADYPSPLLAIMGLPGGGEWIILLVLGLLIFGRRLPEVGRSLGKGIVEFKKGIKGIEEEVESESSRPAPRVTDQSATHDLPRTQPRSEEQAHVVSTENPQRNA